MIYKLVKPLESRLQPVQMSPRPAEASIPQLFAPKLKYTRQYFISLPNSFFNGTVIVWSFFFVICKTGSKAAK